MRLGHGANCSSVGSVIDTLFLGAAAGAAIFAAVCAAAEEESTHDASQAPSPETPLPEAEEER